MDRNFKRTALGLLSVLAGYSATSAASVPTAATCGGCTQAQVLNRARQMGAGTHYLYDLTGNKLHYVYVECEPGAGGTLACYGSEIAPAAEVSQAFAQYRNIIASHNWSEAFADVIHLDMPSGNPSGRNGLPTDRGTVNAYDTLAFPQIELTVENAINDPGNHAGIYATIVSFLAQFNSAVNFAGMTMQVTVVFEDGSQRRYQFDKVSRRYQPIPNTAIDSHNVPIPTLNTGGGGGPPIDTTYV